MPRHIVPSSGNKGGMINYFCPDRIQTNKDDIIFK
jgi:hypothetical protein